MALLQISEPNQAPAPHARRIAIGIDLGTTHSLVAAIRSGVAECLPDEEGRVLLPSVVRYVNAEKREIGFAALDVQVSDPVNTIASVKRLMGRGLADIANVASLPYHLTAKDGMVSIKTVAGEKSPVEVSAEILATLRYRAEDTFDDDIFGAVITVPAYFDDAQRQATKDAAQLAGLNVLRLINEPTAAAIAYGLDNGSEGKNPEGVYAIYDLGGGTFDISILRLSQGVFEVVATGGDSALGGDDFDQVIVDFVLMSEAATPEFVDSAKFLQGEPIAVLTGNEAPIEGFAALRKWASDLFAMQGGQALSPSLGMVMLDERAVRDSMAHKMNPYKASAFAVVKDVIERGAIVLSASNQKQKSFYISAPVVIGGESDIVTVLVHQDINSTRMYLHSVTTKKYLLTRFDSSADATIETDAEQLSGEAKSRDVASVLHRLLQFNTKEPHGLHLSDADKAALKLAARSVKEALTSQAECAFQAEVAGKSITMRLTHDRFVEIAKPLTDRTINAVKKALRDAKLKPSDIDGTVMVGGSTRMPHIQVVVGEFFGKPPLTNLNPDEVVALGAAIQANQLAGNKTGTSADDMLLLDVIPLSLGIETMGGLVERIVPRNQTIPTAMAQDFTTYKDGQTALALHVVQGERDLVADCRSLARFELRGIPPMAAGAAKIRVTFTVDADGLLSVGAVELNSGVEARIDVKPSYGLTDEQIATMLRDSFGTAAQDMAARALAEARLEADRMVIAVQSALGSDRDLLDAGSQAQIDALVVACKASKSLEDAKAMEAATSDLAKATEAFAAARMNAGITRALAGKNIKNL